MLAAVWLSSGIDPISILDLISDIASNSQKGNQHDEIKLSGVAIAENLLRKIHELDLDLSCCVGQGYEWWCKYDGKWTRWCFR